MHDQRGDIILHGLLRTVAGLVLFGLVVFEIGSVIVNRVQVDEAARTATRVAAQSWAERRSTPAARQAALDSLVDQRGIALEQVEVRDDTLLLTVTRRAPVLVVDRIPKLTDYADARVTRTASLGR